MNIFDKITEKMIQQKPSHDASRLDLENFHKNNDHNKKLGSKFIKLIKRDMDNFYKCDFASRYAEDMIDATERMVFSLKPVTNDQFANAFSYFIDCARWYALYYLNTDEARVDTEIDKVSDRLCNLYDLSSLLVLKYFNYDRQEFVMKKENQYYSQTSEEGKTILKFAIDKISTISQLTFSLQNQDNNAVWKCYNKLGEANLYQFMPSLFPEFE